jgi:two-component system, NarL family, sensor kinase
MQKGSPEVVIIIVVSTILLLALAGFIVSFLLMYQRRHYRHQQEMAKMKDIYQQEVLKTQLEIREQTLTNISQEIHDNIGQVLSLAKLNLNTLQLEQPEQEGLINDTKDLVSKAIGDLRDISKSLNADRLVKIGLPEALRADVNLLKKNGSYMTVLRIEGNEIRFDTQKEIVLYRLVQEAINNIIKHAQAKSIEINLNFTPESLELAVIDDGKGFDMEAMIEKGGGSGLKNMTNRARLIDATFDMTSTPGVGTRIQIRLPI